MRKVTRRGLTDWVESWVRSNTPRNITTDLIMREWPERFKGPNRQHDQQAISSSLSQLAKRGIVYRQSVGLYATANNVAAPSRRERGENTWLITGTLVSWSRETDHPDKSLICIRASEVEMS